MRRYPAPAGRVCRPGRSPRAIARRSCGTWQLANGAGMSWPAWPGCPPCCAGCPPGPPRSLPVRVPRRPSGMRGRRCWAGCSAGWLCGDAAVGGAGRGRDRAGGHSRYRLGAASGHAPAWAGGSRERPGDREPAGLPCSRTPPDSRFTGSPRYRNQVELRRQLRPALATGDRALDGGHWRDRRRRLDHPLGRLDPGDVPRASPLYRQRGHRSGPGQGEWRERIRRAMARSHGPGRCGARLQPGPWPALWRQWTPPSWTSHHHLSPRSAAQLRPKARRGSGA